MSIIVSILDPIPTPAGKEDLVTFVTFPYLDGICAIMISHVFPRTFNNTILLSYLFETIIYLYKLNV